MQTTILGHNWYIIPKFCPPVNRWAENLQEFAVYTPQANTEASAKRRNSPAESALRRAAAGAGSWEVSGSVPPGGSVGGRALSSSSSSIGSGGRALCSGSRSDVSIGGSGSGVGVGSGVAAGAGVAAGGVSAVPQPANANTAINNVSDNSNNRTFLIFYSPLSFICRVWHGF